ncbi:MAG: DNA polymerase III subunit alpha, partial [Bdellovibrionaceae bacterium]|nr:DNA polymerase III subunit alpha [Pseudobdellovibrionaceae bacterium]
PILGCEVYYVEDRSKKQKMAGQSFRDPSKSYKTLILLAKNLEGYRNLCRINTSANQTGFYFLPRADYSLLDQYKEGLIVMTGGVRGRLPYFFNYKGKDEALKEIETLQQIFGAEFYLQLQTQGVSNCESYNNFLAEIAQKNKIPLVIGGDVHYIEKEDSVTQDVLFCIGANRTLYDKERTRLGPPEFYFKNQKEMEQMFSDDFYQSAYDNTMEIAKQCKVRFKIKDKKNQLVYHLTQVAKKVKSLEKLAYEGLKSRFKEAQLRGEEILAKKEHEYKERIKYELKIIEDMGFNGYFHIVYDFINWARKNNIPVGPGRGSGASSLVSFCLRITDLDPMPLNLIFERFLNPERISMPDFDIDFCQENRHRVIEYINQKYGSDCSSHVITYGRLNVRAAVRDVGRVLALSYSEVDQIAKLIPDILGITLKEALKKEPRLKEMQEEDPKIAELIHLTSLLEGLIRHVGIHAAGIIIADNPIINYAPLYRGAEGENVIQYDLKYAEKIGLVKFDFLGLKTLTQIAETFRLIKETTGKEITSQQISLKDNGIYEIMCQGSTVGIFQFEGVGITDLLIKSQPTCFEDIIAINALYRPGPMNMIPDYLNRKKAQVPVKYIFPDLEPILKETYGIIVYQEQVQKIAVEIAGYSYGEADVLRRAMGKKIRSVMAKQKDRFLEGAKKKSYNLKKAEELFDLMAEFAKYGFNKSHAAAYCVLAAQTAWLKRYYPRQFLAAQMTIDQNDSDKLVKYIRDAKKSGFEILSPHVNSSFERFSIQGEKICFSLGAIKGIGLNSAKEVVKARESLKDKTFSSLEEFLSQTEKLNKKTIESLVKSGALDNFGYNRREIIMNIGQFVSQAEKQEEDLITGQQSLFDGDLEIENRVRLLKTPSWSRKEQVGFEREVLGFYLNDHPMKSLEGLEKGLNCQSISSCQLNSLSQSRNIKTLSMITNVREFFTKKGQRMAFCMLEDGLSNIEATLFPKIYEQVKNEIIHEGEVFYITGKLQKDKRSSNQIIIEDISLLDDFLKNVSKVYIQIFSGMKEQDILNLKNLIENSKQGSSKVCLQTYLPEEKIFVEIDMDKFHDIEVTHEFLQKSYKIFKSSKSIRLYH